MHSNSSADPANFDTLTGLFRQILNATLLDLNKVLPARVIAFDRAANRVQVQPLISVLSSDGGVLERAQIASIPVFQIGGGGYLLNFNLVAGDLGWIVANDRDISLFLQSYNEERPNTNRLHNFSDSVFMPDIMHGFTIASEDESGGHAVLQSLDGSVRVALWPDKVKITAPNGLEVDGVITCKGITGTVSSGNAATLTGNLRVIGNITASGSITPFVP